MASSGTTPASGMGWRGSGGAPRRSIVVSKAQRMVDVSIALFARFAANNRIADLISMLT
jgi:hypothetical protein